MTQWPIHFFQTENFKREKCGCCSSDLVFSNSWELRSVLFCLKIPRVLYIELYRYKYKSLWNSDSDIFWPKKLPLIQRNQMETTKNTLVERRASEVVTPGVGVRTFRPRHIIVVLIGPIHTALPTEEHNLSDDVIVDKRVICTKDKQIITRIGEATILKSTSLMVHYICQVGWHKVLQLAELNCNVSANKSTNYH